MKKYNVYGIGNALVDMEIEVTPHFLEKMNIDKGVMTLVDTKTQLDILEKLDGSQHKRSCGGSAANTIIAVSQFGGRSFYSCKVANDETGDFYYQDLVESGVQTNLSGDRPEGHTGKCMVFITPDADRTMYSCLGITATLSHEEVMENEIKESEFAYLEGYLVASETGRAAAIHAREIAEKHGVKTALTFSDPNMVTHFKAGLDEMLGPKGVDLLFCNEAEALGYTNTKTVEEAAEKLKSIATAFAITQGPRGAYLFDGNREIDVVTNKVDAVDTNGAGDLFAGAFLYAITHGHDFHEAGKLACAASSQLVTKFGARLTREQATEVKKRIL